MNEAGSVIVKFEADTARFRAEIDKIKASMGGVEEQTKQTASVLSGFKNVLIGIAGLQVGRSIASTTLELDSLAKGFRFATGSAEAAAEELDYVRKVSDELGVELISTAKQYAGLAASAKGTALEGQRTRDVFYGITAAASAMGKSSADTAGILNAVQQMMSKGTVSAEELRGQMGERMWGAFQQAAQAIGLTTQELGKQLELGNVMADQLLPILADRMLELAKAAGTGTGLQAELNRLNNTWTDLVAEFANSGGIAAATVAIQELTRWTKEWQTVAKPMIGVIQEIDATLAHLAGSNSILDFFPKLRDVAAGAAIALDQVSTALRGFREWFNADSMETFSKSAQVRLPKGLFADSKGQPRVPMSLGTDESAPVGAKPRATATPRRDVLGLLGNTGGGTSAAARAKKEAEDIRKTFDDIMSDSRQRATEMLNDLTDAQLKMAIDANVLAFQPMTDRIDGIALAWSSVKDAAVDALSQIIFKGGEASEIVGQLMQMLASEVFKAAWSGDTKSVGGGIISAVSEFLGGMLGRAGGGPVNARTPYMVGENGPELFVPSAAGHIKANGFGGGQSVVINQNFSFEGVNAATVTMLRSEAGRIADQVKREVVPIVVNAQRRNQMAGAF